MNQLLLRLNLKNSTSQIGLKYKLSFHCTDACYERYLARAYRGAARIFLRGGLKLWKQKL